MKSLIVRNRIIKTAAELFYQNGYNSTGINEIIKKSEIAKATLYNHFKSKEDLCVAYLKYYNGEFLIKIDTYIKTATEENKIIALFDFLNTFYNTENFNGCCLINTVSELAKDNIKIRTEIKNQKNKLIKLIKQLVNDTYISKTEVENKVLATQVYLIFESALVESHLQQENWSITVAKELCKQILKNY